MYVLYSLKMVSNTESFCLYSTLTTFFAFDIFKKITEKINGEDVKIYQIERWGRRRTRNGVLEAGDGKYK